MAEEVKKDEPKKKGPFGKLKEAVDDKEEQLVILSTFVRLGVMIWAGAILTLNYVEIPGYKQEQKIDPTFIASVFTGVLATFGVQAGNKKNGGGGSANISKKDMYRIFNCGIGMVLFIDSNDSKKLVAKILELGYKSYAIGKVRSKNDNSSVKFL